MRHPLAAALWPEGTAADAFAILDGARSPRIAELLRASTLSSCCLYAGKLSPRLEAAAPHLVHLRPGAPEVEELFENAWGASWGVFVRASGDLEGLRRHFRRFLRVRTEAGQTLVFRYYDPRVLRVYLPTCNVVELSAVFGHVVEFVVEDESPDAILHYARDPRGELETRRAALAQPEWSQVLPA